MINLKTVIISIHDLGGAIKMAKCEICDKSVNFGNQLSITRSHISKRSTRTFKPNLRTVKVIVDGQPKKIKVCAKCLRSGKVNKA